MRKQSILLLLLSAISVSASEDANTGEEPAEVQAHQAEIFGFGQESAIFQNNPQNQAPFNLGAPGNQGFSRPQSSGYFGRRTPLRQSNSGLNLFGMGSRSGGGQNLLPLFFILALSRLSARTTTTEAAETTTVDINSLVTQKNLNTRLGFTQCSNDCQYMIPVASATGVVARAACATLGDDVALANQKVRTASERLTVLSCMGFTSSDLLIGLIDGNGIDPGDPEWVDGEAYEVEDGVSVVYGAANAPSTAAVRSTAYTTLAFYNSDTALLKYLCEYCPS